MGSGYLWDATNTLGIRAFVLPNSRRIALLEPVLVKLDHADGVVRTQIHMLGSLVGRSQHRCATAGRHANLPAPCQW